MGQQQVMGALNVPGGKCQNSVKQVDDDDEDDFYGVVEKPGDALTGAESLPQPTSFPVDEALLLEERLTHVLSTLG